MQQFEIVKILDVAPIILSSNLSDRILYRLHIIAQKNRHGKFRLRVYRKEDFFVALDQPNEAHGIRRKIRIMVEDISPNWLDIDEESEEKVFGAFYDDLQSTFEIGSKNMQEVMNYREVVKVVELDTIEVEETNECFKFRIEILKSSKNLVRYEALVYQLIRFTLQPTFPVENPEFKLDAASVVVSVEDQEFDWKSISSDSIDETLQIVISSLIHSVNNRAKKD